MYIDHKNIFYDIIYFFSFPFLLYGNIFPLLFILMIQSIILAGAPQLTDIKDSNSPKLKKLKVQ